MPLIEHVDWRKLDQLVLRQQRNRSAHAPVISLFRWWARRSHCFASAILEAATREFRSDQFLVADPFSGGGTVAFEAARRGLPVYAQDLYPWPSCALATALTSVSADAFEEAAHTLLANLDEHRRAYWARAADGEWWETTHIIRVRTARCSECATNIFLFRDALISLASRRSDERWGFFGCAACGAVSKRGKGVLTFTCADCKRRSSVNASPKSRQAPSIHCPHCRAIPSLAALLRQPPLWHPVLVREHRPKGKDGIARIRPIETTDLSQNDSLGEREGLQTAIPDGIETGHLKRHGFVRWCDLYTPRQLATLTGALEAIDQLGVSDAVARHLRLAVLGATEMPGYLCRWERFHPKALEAIANHRFSRTTVAVETNLLSPSGRGTLPRRFEAASKALRWMRTASYPVRITHAAATSPRRMVDGALVVTGSSERQLLNNGQARLVFTDPPYHDDLQYGELARLFHAWMRHAYGTAAPDEKTEAVPNPLRGTGTAHYKKIVAACFSESNRTLAANGRLVLTFHNRDLRAWEALAGALRDAQFVAIGLALVLAENAADHSKRGKQTFLSDLVIECRPRCDVEFPDKYVPVQGSLRTPERRNLAAIGIALAHFVNRHSTDRFEALFLAQLKALKTRRVLIRRGRG